MKTTGNKMSLLEKISYGAGNMGICLATTAITAFVMYFYTDVVGIGLIQVGTIMLIGLFFLVAAAFAVSGIANVLYGNVPAGIDRILGAVALFALGIWYIVRERR